MMLSDIEIAQKAELKPITEIGASIGIPAEDLENYGPYKAKVSLKLTKELENKPMGHLILVTAISPTPAGEGKTTTTVGLGQALAHLGKKAMIWGALARRGLEPSIPIKFAIALMGVGAGFLFLVWGASFVGSEFKVGMVWLAGLYLIHSIAELCISPVGLSMITKLSIARIVGMMMGVFFLASAMAQYRPGNRPGKAGRSAAAVRQAQLGYSPLVVPSERAGTRCVIIDPRLCDVEPLAWSFCLNFARDNGLKVETA